MKRALSGSGAGAPGELGRDKNGETCVHLNNWDNMSCLEKMLIKGIRSFSPDNECVIEFYRPLTLIVGQNGAGKTTIIECLKMACTGELPPNTRSGQTFIHDPKVSGVSEVKGQIKLRFRSQNSEPIVIIRSFQLTQKRTKLEFKTLDATVHAKDKATSKTNATSHKCIEVDKLIPQMMGVDKAILENVIFVHQEDSNWPLSEGAVLKKKFDDIFSATKYTKALEALNKLKKEKKDAVKLMLAEQRTLEAFRDRAVQLRRELRHQTAEVEGCKKAIEEKEIKREELQGTIRQLNEQWRRVQKEASDLRLLQEQHTLLERRVAELRGRIMPGDLEDIDAMELVDLEDKAAEARNQSEQLAERSEEAAEFYRIAMGTLQSTKDAQLAEVARNGALKADRDAHEGRKRERDDQARRLAARHGLPEGSTWQQVDARLDGLVATQRDALEVSRREAAEREAAADRRYDEAAGRMAAHSESVNVKTRDVANKKKKMAELDSLAMGGFSHQNRREQLERRQEELRAAQERQRQASSRPELRDLPSRIAQAQREIGDLRLRLNGLKAERERAAAVSNAETRRSMKVDELDRKIRDLTRIRDEKRALMAEALELGEFGVPPALEDIPRALHEAADRAGAAVSDATRHSAQLDQEVLRARREVDAAKQKAESAAAEAAGLLENVRKLVGGAKTPSLIAVAHSGTLEALDASMAELSREGGEVMINRAKVQARQHLTELVEGALEKPLPRHAKKPRTEPEPGYILVPTNATYDGPVCPLCARGWVEEGTPDQPGSLAAFRNEVSSAGDVTARISQLDARQADIQKDMQVAAAARSLLERRAAAEDRAQKAAGDRAAAQERLVAKEQSAKEASDQARSLTSRSAAATRAVQEAGALLQRALVEKGALQRELDSLSLEVDRAGGMGGRRLETIDHEVRDVEDQLDAQQQRKDLDGKDLDRYKQAELLATTEVSRLQTEVEELRKRAQELESSEALREALQRDLLQLESEITALQARRLDLERAVEDARKEREDARSRCRDAVQRAEQSLASVRAESEAFRGLTRAIVAGEARVEEYEDSQDRLAELAEAIVQQAAAAEEAKVQRDRVQGDGAGLRESLRAYEDAMAYRGSSVELAELSGRVAELGERVAPEVTQDLQKQLGSAEWAEARLRDEINVLQGKLKATDTVAAQTQKSLEAKDLKDIDLRLLRHVIDVKSNEMALADSERYGRALEKALLRFHTDKMANINKTIKELWQRTYRNQDIDYVQLKADVDEAAAGKSQRSYNYRVVMNSGGAELDMRGRCSAGQKVLACLIIRLALAETFSANCGILALDEPTTNLDAANSASLAEALRSIVDARAGQRSFQLIVITHDEDFAHKIGTRDFCDYYYRVTKQDGQHSTVDSVAVYE